jgi:hypothetical protein
LEDFSIFFPKINMQGEENTSTWRLGKGEQSLRKREKWEAQVVEKC